MLNYKVNLEYVYSTKNYISIWSKIIVSYLTIIFIFALTTQTNSDPLWSYCTLSIASLIGLRLFYYFFLKDIGFSGFRIILCAFLFKLIISTIHFLIFIQPDYFVGNTIYNFDWEFYWMHDSIQYLSEMAKQVGFSKALTFDYFIENKGAVIFYLYSPFYFIGGNLVLNLCHISTVFTLFTAILVTYMAKNFYNLNNKQLYATLTLTSFFPFDLITTITIRDFAGQFLLAIGLISLQYAFKNSKLFFLLIISSVLFFFHRKVYIILPFITYLILLLFYTDESGFVRFSNKFNIRLVLLSVFIIFGIYFYKLATQIEVIDTEKQLNADYLSDITTIQFYLLLPIYIFKGFLGPFPWTQFFRYEEATIYQLGDYLTSTFIFTTILCLWLNRKKIPSFREDINVVSLTSLLISLAGISSGFMHLGYISLSIIYLVPFFMKYINLNFFLRNYLFVFVFMIFLSVMWVALGFQGEGIWSGFKS